MQLQVADIAAVDGHSAGGDVVEAWQQAEQGALAAARGADEGDGLAGGDRQGDIRQGRGRTVGGRAIGEGDVVETDGGRAGVERRGVGRLADLGLDIEGGE